MNAFNTKISSCQNTISKETNTSLYLKANKKASEASFPPRPSSLSLVPSSSFPSVPSLPPLYPLVLYSKSLIELLFLLEPLLTFSFPGSIKICPFKIRPSKDPNVS